MIAIRYQVCLEEPVLVTSLQGDPNSAVAFDYLPGSVLRGALIGRLLKNRVSHDDPIMRRRFFENSTRFLNAYPVLNEKRSLPTPRSWIEKDSSAADELLGAKFDKDVKRKRVQKAFHQRDGDNVWLHTPDHHIAIHIERSRIGVPQGDQGEVYRYDSLEEGATYEGVILCDHAEDAVYFEREIKQSFTLWIGGARTAGYGRTRWEYIARDTAWSEHKHGQAEGPWVIAFLSPALLRDENGQYAVDQTAILEHLGLPKAPASSVIDSEMIGGFNRKWGLPLPQMLAVSAGSVIRLADPSLSFKIDALEWAGIGERRVDGFGRIAIYRQADCEFKIQTFSKTTAPAEDHAVENTVALSLVANRIRRDRKRQGIEARAHDDNHALRKVPRRTQLNALREAVAKGIRLESPSLQPVMTFLKSTDQRYFSRTQFEEARINGRSFIHWLHGVLNGTLEKDITHVGDVMDAGVALRLIDAVVARAVRTVEKSKQ